jgi:hypothetical protein
LNGLLGDDMGIDRGKVELPSDEEENGSHGLEASVSARPSLGGLEQSVDGFDEAVGLAGLGPGDDAIEMLTYHGGEERGFRLATPPATGIARL